MTTLKNASILMLGLMGASLGQVQAIDKKVKKKPNVLFFLVDDLGWMDTGYQGSKFYETPNIDQLAKEGVRFSDAYASHPRCVPSRYSLITGKYPARAHVPGPGKVKLRSDNSTKLNPDDYTIADAMKSQGYSTFFIGKWHLASGGDYPQDVGFKINIAGGKAGSPISYFYPYNERNGKVKSKKAPILGLENGKEGEYLTDRITNETEKYLDEQHREDPQQPFFAYVSHYAVHEPLMAKPEYIKKFKEKLKTMHYTGPEFIPEGTGTTKMRQDDPVYAAMIYSMDESLGRIVRKLKELGEYDNTIIILFSDNGGLSDNGDRPRRVATSNQPLRAGKGHLYEGGIREPMIVKWPGVTKAGGESNATVIGTDFYPTILEMIGAPLRPKAHLDGESFVWALKNKKNPDPNRAVFWHSPVGRPHATGDTNSSAIRQGDYKLIEWYETGHVELYNIKKDLREEHDLSKEKPELTQKLLDELHQWRKSIHAYMGKPGGREKGHKKSE